MTAHYHQCPHCSDHTLCQDDCVLAPPFGTHYDLPRGHPAPCADGSDCARTHAAQQLEGIIADLIEIADTLSNSDPCVYEDDVTHCALCGQCWQADSTRPRCHYDTCPWVMATRWVDARKAKETKRSSAGGGT